MLLQRLRAYAEERLKLPPTLYSEAPVRYIIELDGTGRLLTPELIDTADPANRRTRRGQPRPVPQIQRASAVRPLLLADKADYVLGFAKEGAKPERAAAAHRAFIELLRQCAEATGEPAVAAVLAFLTADPLAQLELPEDFDPGALMTFRVDGTFPVDLPSVQAFWATANAPGASPDKPAPVMQCLVCGEERPVLERLQGKIKGVPGGQSSGTAIISANAPAFESYGLSASLIAPTCDRCGELFTKAANSLLANEETHIVMSGTVSIFWPRRDVGFSVRTFLTDPRPEQVRALYEAVYSGKRQPEVDDIAFYATVLSGSGGRTVVRDWIDTTVGQVKRGLARWFTLQEIVGLAGEDPTPQSLYALAGATVRDLKDLSPQTPRALLSAALIGTPLPWELLYQSVRRNHAEQRVTRQRAALIKLVLLSNERREKEDAMVRLDPDHPNPAYHCGRLLAVLEQVQRQAVPGIKATIVDRFFGSASSAPGAVFGRLLRGAQPHLAKLERDRPAAWTALQRRLEDIQAQLPGFPMTLNLRDQGLFALGYYHQRAFDRAQAREASERRRSGLPASDDAALLEVEMDGHSMEEGEEI